MIYYHAGETSGHKLLCRAGRRSDVFNLSTIAMVLGAGLFVLPVPGTFILGGVLMLAGIAAYLLGN